MLCTDSQVTGSRPLLPPALRLKVLMVLSALKRILKKKPQRPWKYIALELPGSKLWRPFGDGHSLENVEDLSGMVPLSVAYGLGRAV